MFKYHAFGLNIESSLELPGLLEASGDEVDVKISLGELTTPLNHDGPNYYVDNGDVYLWWEDIGEVKIKAGEEITVDLWDEEEQIIPFLLGPVMALLLHQRGFLVLHGSSVKINHGAVAFLGHRTYGKSTTAINLYKKGYPLITDDILAIKFNEKGNPYVYPGYMHVRLSEDSYKDVKDNTTIITPIRTIVGKRFCDTSYRFSPEPVKLERIYILDKSDKIGISKWSNQKDLIDLIVHSVAHRIFNKQDQANNLIQCADLINKIDIRRLEIIHSYKDLPQIIEIIEEDISHIKNVNL